MGKKVEVNREVSLPYLLPLSDALFDVDLEREFTALELSLLFILLSDALLLPVFFEDVFLLLLLLFII
jgi:hypothetical protein